VPARSVAFEELNFAFVLFCRLPSLKGPEITTFAGLGVLLSRVEPVLAGL